MARMFERMITSLSISLRLLDYRSVAAAGTVWPAHPGAIDEYFDHIYGRLPYRSLTFRFETLDMERFQNRAGVVN